MIEQPEARLSASSVGTVTLLFTDIEGSTNLLARLQEDYQELLTTHNSIVRRALARWNGREVNTEGDSFFAVFVKTADAVSAVVDIQRDLYKQVWPEGVQVRVRMGLHTGEPWVVDEDYMGMDVHRAARIGHAGYGGQVLLSETTTALVEGELPDGVTLLNLGAHKLKDMRRPELIHQLVIDGLPSEFPPLKARDSAPTNLPEQLTTFVGRDREMKEIRELLDKHRLLTLVGPGGSGKTSLLLQVAANALDAYPQGVWFVNLEPIESFEDLVPALAQTLQFALDFHSSDLAPRQQLFDFLSKQSVFFVLDNFEHLMDGAGLLADILKASHEVRLLVTSRERLNLREEWVYPMHGLSYPSNGDSAGFEAYSGVVLFAERARQVEPGFAISADNIEAISRICRLVDGLPLGIELAAAWVNILTPQEIADEIARDIDFLASTTVDMPDKHRSLRAIFNQSWGRLTPQQQAGFRRLGVFHGGFSREALQEAAGVSLMTFSQLVQKSLVNRDSEGRFELHPLLKVFAREKLAEAPDEQEAAVLSHSRYYARFLADRAHLVQGSKIRELREEMRAEHDNIMAAVVYAITRWEDEEAAYDTLVDYSFFAVADGFHRALATYRRLDEQLRQAGAALNHDAPKTKLLLNVLIGRAWIGNTIGEPEAEPLAEKCIPLLRELAMDYELGLALMVKGIASEYRSEFNEAIGILAESLEYLKDKNDPFVTTDCLTWLGWAYYELGDLDQAWKYFHDSYEVSSGQDNILGLPYAMSKLGTWADARQDYEQGAAYHKEALKYFEAIDDLAGQGYALSRVSLSAWGMKDYEGALHFGRRGYEQFEAIGHRWGTATAISRIGFAELELGRYEEAQTHFYEGFLRALDYDYPATVNYALMGLAVLWAKQGDLERGAGILITALESPKNAYLYSAIGRQALAEIKEQLPAETLAMIEEVAQGRNLDEVIEQIRRDRLAAAPPSISA
jgi:predicted ATPase/class 3 adenylate cyclase